MVKRPEFIRLSVAALMLAAFFASQPGLTAEFDTAREQDPRIQAEDEVKKVARFDARLKPLWLEALGRPEAELQRQAADAIARARALGMPGLEEAVPHLLRVMEAPEAHPLVRLSAARALIALDARKVAPALMVRAQADGFATAHLVEPALARWDYAPMRPMWQARLSDPRTSPGHLTLAIQAVVQVKLAEAVPDLRRLALDPRITGNTRLEAALALAVLQPAGLEADVRRLASDGSAEKVLDRLIAATLLTHHRGAAAETILLDLARDREPAVATVAVRRLVEVDPARLQPVLPELVSGADSGLRLLAARAVAEARTPEAMERLGSLLEDPHREVRMFARESLVRLAGVEPLGEAARKAVVRALGSKNPAGLEQAATAAGALRHEPAADRLAQRLSHGDPEVRGAAAWALRRLAVPATAAAVLERVRIDTDKPRMPPRRVALPGSDPAKEAVDPHAHLEHLIETLGALRHRPAVPVLSRYLPMPPIPLGPGDNPLWRPELRAAAVWSLARIEEKAPPPKLVTILRQRLGGESGETRGGTMKREDDAGVRAQAAVGLGRMKVKESIPELQRIYQDEKDLPQVRRASAWALESITGERMPDLKLPSEPREVWHGGWFLEPLGKPR